LKILSIMIVGCEFSCGPMREQCLQCFRKTQMQPHRSTNNFAELTGICVLGPIGWAVGFGEDAGGLLADGSDVEISAGALRYLGLAMAKDAIGGNVVFAHQVNNQTGQGAKLLWRWMGLVEIADEADADAICVVAVVQGVIVSAPLLLGPARADFDLAVAAVGAVADDEVIAKFVEATVAMPFVDDGSRAVIAVAVMDNDPCPMVSRYGGNPCSGDAGTGVGVSRLAAGIGAGIGGGGRTATGAGRTGAGWAAWTIGGERRTAGKSASDSIWQPARTAMPRSTTRVASDAIKLGWKFLRMDWVMVDRPSDSRPTRLSANDAAAQESN
jgi:hypothetical protein